MARLARLSKFIPQDWTWREDALCRGLDASTFFEDYEDGNDWTRRKIVSMCDDCPVFEQCDEFAKRTGATGVFAGAYYWLGRRRSLSFSPKEDIDA